MFFNVGFCFGQVYDPYPYPCPIPDGGFLYSLSSSQTATESFGKLPTPAKDKVLSTRKELRPYVDIDMGRDYKISKIRLTSPTEPRQKTYSIFVSSEKFPDRSHEELRELAADNASIKVIPESRTFSSSDSVAFFPPLEGRYFRIQLNGDEPQSLVLSGLEFFGVCGGGAPPRDPENSYCDNGGLELGSYDGWKGESGQWGFINGERTQIFNSVGITGDRHKLIALPLVDPFAPISTPCKGDYIIKLGNDLPGSDAERLTYTLSVTAANANFFFRYAFVLDDAPHTPEENPFFQWRIYYLQNNVKFDAVPGQKIVNNPQVFDPFFDRITKDRKTYLYKNWTCVNVNLSSYIGQTLYVEFTNADCAAVLHSAHSYIDGLCTSLADNTPKGIITGKNAACNEADLVFSGEGSCNTNRYTWSMSELTSSGQEINTHSKDFFNVPGKINIGTFYQEQFNFDVNKRYRLKLTVGNDCLNGTTVFKDINVPNWLSTSYKNVAICNGYFGDIKMVNTAPCSSCTVQWSPSYKFFNPSEPNATLRPQFAQCGATFTVTTTDQVGCQSTNDVKFYVIDPLITATHKDVDKTDVGNVNPPKSVYCGYEIKVDVHSTCLPIRYFNLGLSTEADPNFQTTSWFDAYDEVNGNYTYKYIIPQKLGDNIRNTSGKVMVNLTLNDAGNNFVKLYGNCMPSATINLENRFWYFGYWRNGQVGINQFVNHLLPINGSPGIFLPNTVNTASPNPENSQFKAFGANNYGYSAFWYRVEVYNRWGDRVFVREETADQPTINLHNRFYDNSWIRWDGKVNGQWVNDATFVWHINMENCSDQRKSQGNLPENWKGEVNVFR